jgi:DNA-binding response OmpR family regulator
VRVLIIADHPDAMHALALRLREHGCDVLEKANCKAALSQAQTGDVLVSTSDSSGLKVAQEAFLQGWCGPFLLTGTAAMDDNELLPSFLRGVLAKQHVLSSSFKN